MVCDPQRSTGMWATHTDGTDENETDENDKKLYRIDNAHIGDPTIVELTSPTTGSNSFVSDIAINPNDANEIMVVYSNYSCYSLFHSFDGGQTWQKVAGNLEQTSSGSGNGPSCRNAEIIPLGNNTLYVVGTSVGLFGTANLNDINTVWEQIADQKIGSVVCEYLTYRPNDGLLVVATHGNGIYQTNLTSLSDVLSVDEINNKRFDFGVFPNPVEDNFYLQTLSLINKDVEINIYDEIGRLIKSFKRKLNMGSNKFDLNISDLKPAIYFVSMKVGDELIFKQIIKK